VAAQAAESRGLDCDVVLILLALGLAIFGVVRLGRTLEPGQRIVLVLVFVVALVWLILKLVQLGYLGRATAGT
jgi:hypothetical protein